MLKKCSERSVIAGSHLSEQVSATLFRSLMEDSVLGRRARTLNVSSKDVEKGA